MDLDFVAAFTDITERLNIISDHPEFECKSRDSRRRKDEWHGRTC